MAQHFYKTMYRFIPRSFHLGVNFMIDIDGLLCPFSTTENQLKSSQLIVFGLQV